MQEDTNMKDELFGDLSTSYADVIDNVVDNREELADLPILTRMEFEAVPLVDCFNAVRNYMNSPGAQELTRFKLTTLMYYLTIGKRVEPIADLPYKPNYAHRALLIGHNNRFTFKKTIMGAMKQKNPNLIYKVKPEYDISKMKFGFVDSNPVMAIKQGKIKGQIDPSMFPHNLPEVNLSMYETVLDFTPTTYNNLLKLQEYTDPKPSEPYYPNESGELPSNIFTWMNREYEAELHKRELLPKDIWLSDIAPLVQNNVPNPLVSKTRIWVTENEVMRGKQIESLYQRIRMDANEQS